MYFFVKFYIICINFVLDCVWCYNKLWNNLFIVFVDNGGYIFDILWIYDMGI